MGTGFFRFGHCARPRIPNRRDTLLYEDEFELTFQVPEEESAPEPLAAPAAKPAAPMEPVADEPTRIMTLENRQRLWWTNPPG